MTTGEAERIRRGYHRLSDPTEEDSFLYTEALAYLIEETKDPARMTELGSYYYERRDFDLALKYYELAAAAGHHGAIVGLGYIWYYGRTGTKDYGKAFHYYSLGAETGDLICAYKVADMYKNGYYVRQDYDEYARIIERLYPEVRGYGDPNAPIPEIFTRLAGIRTRQGRTDEAVGLYLDARSVLARRIEGDAFFGDLTIMKFLIRDLYELTPYPAEEPDLYDLYHLLETPGAGSISLRGKPQTIRAERQEDGSCAVCFNGKWYRTADDFFAKARADDTRLTALYDDLYDLRWTAEEET